MKKTLNKHACFFVFWMGVISCQGVTVVFTPLIDADNARADTDFNITALRFHVEIGIAPDPLSACMLAFLSRRPRP